MVSPVWNAIVGSTRNAATSAKSSGVPHRRTGVRAVVLSTNFWNVLASASRSVSVQPGRRALQRTRWRASSAPAFSLRSSLRAQIATDAPAWATPLARPRPMPVLPPVTTTTLLVRSTIGATLPPALDVQRREVVDLGAELLPGGRREHERQPRHAQVAELCDLIGD